MFSPFQDIACRLGKHKFVMLEAVSEQAAKVECSFCGRSIIKNNLLKHEKSSICQRHRIRIIEINNFQKLKNTTD